MKMKKKDMRGRILLINFAAVIMIAIGIVKNKPYLIPMLIIGVIMMIISLVLSTKYKKMANEEQQTV